MSVLIGWLAPELQSAESPTPENKLPPKAHTLSHVLNLGEIFISMEQVPPGGADLYGAPDAPATIAEALKQRMEKYQATNLIIRNILETDINGEIPG